MTKRRKTRKRTFIVENTWVCSSCKCTNKGRHMKCQSCGSPKEKHEKYDTSKNLTSPEVSNPELLAQAKAGKNWKCEFCGNDQRDTFGSCQQCGAERVKKPTISEKCPRCGSTGWVEDPACPACPIPIGDETIEKVKKSNLERTFVTNTGGYREAPQTYSETGKPRKAKKSFNWRFFTVGLLTMAGVASIVGFLVWAFVPHEEHVVVDDIYWRYDATLQQRKLNHGEDWDGNMPNDAFNVSCLTQEHGTEDCNPYDCNCHEVTNYCSEDCNCRESCSTSCSDNGNGYSTCNETCSEICSTCEVACGSHTECDTCYEQCTVYDEWCEYEYYTWITLTTQWTQGHCHNPFEPDLQIQDNPPSPQRIIREHQYLVTFKNDEGDTWEYAPENLTEFNHYAIDEHWLIEVTHVGGVFPQREE